MSLVDLLILVAGLGVAGLAKGTTGMGLPLVATPILAGIFGPRPAVVIVTIPIFAANTMLLAQGWRSFDVLRGIGPIVVASVLGTVVGVNLLALLDQRAFAVLISAMVALFLFRGDRLIGSDPAARRARLLGPLVGVAAGVLQGTTSISSPIMGSYFHARRLPAAEYVLVLAAIFELNSIVQLVGYSLLGLYTPPILAIGLVGLVPALLGLLAGIVLRGRIEQERFRQLIVVLLIASVANLLYRSFIA